MSIELGMPSFGPKEVQCGNCTAACCRQGIVMQLAPQEVTFMRDSGTELALFGEPADTSMPKRVLGKLGLADTRQMYYLETDCGNLAEEDGAMHCVAYEDPERPAACQDFSVGSFGCRQVRMVRGVDSTEEFSHYLDWSL